jgi:hypothetical protein
MAYLYLLHKLLSLQYNQNSRLMTEYFIHMLYKAVTQLLLMKEENNEHKIYCIKEESLI